MTAPLYKGKGTKNHCSDYKGISLFSIVISNEYDRFVTNHAIRI